MDKRTVLFIVLSVVIILGFTFFQRIFLTQPTETPDISEDTEVSEEEITVTDETSIGDETPLEGLSNVIIPVEKTDLIEKNIEIKTNQLHFTFSTLGANAVSIKLPAYTESDGSEVDMVISENSGQYPFNIVLDDFDTRDTLFEYKKISDNEHEFIADLIYFDQNGEEIPFTLTKSLVCYDNEYMIEFRVKIETEGGVKLPLPSYQFEFGPQIGPQYMELGDRKGDYRHYIIFTTDGQRKTITDELKDGAVKMIEERHNWAAIEGKYFLLIGKTYIADYNKIHVGFSTEDVNGLRDRSSILFLRDLTETPLTVDTYRFYMGPKKQEELSRYNKKEDNAFNESGLSFDKVIDDFWGWLSGILKIPLVFFHSITGNWGVAIILLTILIKLLFFPITFKSFESTSKMQALSPKMQDIKNKYSKDPQKMNQAMAELYKSEGVNPLGGCLPLLLQLPIFFALFSLFSNYFEFRGAAFLPPWIADLSQPEKLFSLPFTIPLIFMEISEFRILPFLMVGMTFLQQRIMQTPGQAANQTKMIMYIMPLVFFFIMYNMPSGLVLYWTMQSLFTFLQQFYFNYFHKKKKNDKSGKAK
jgi:YidC/Oxa1 family membrane protein insertase